jgi:S-adenosylmethionine decarboxylase
MYSESSRSISGKHMICDIHGIKNKELLENLESIKQVLDTICETHKYSILGKLEHKFHPEGITIIYLLSESHISVHTFPEREYIALDIYTCREYPDDQTYLKIYDYLVNVFDAIRENPQIIDRRF